MAKRPGRPEERLKIDAPLSEAIKTGLSRKRPPGGWPKPEKPSKSASPKK